MKRFASMICAVALAAVCAVPAFAEATPGEVAKELAAKEYRTWTADDLKDFTDAVTAINTNAATNAVINPEMRSAFNNAYSYVTSGSYSGYRSVYKIVPLGVDPRMHASIYSKTTDSDANFAETASFAAVEGKDDTYELTVDYVKIDGTNADSELGFAVDITIPACGNDTYVLLHNNDDGTITTINTEVNNFGDGVNIRAWVPHFSTYTLVGSKKPVPTPAPAAPAAPETPEATPAPAPTATPAPAAPAPAAVSPIKATGADMSAAALAVALVTAASVGGAAYLTKKNGLGK